jgi:hypothetical protein
VGSFRKWANSWRKRREDRPLISLGTSDGRVEGLVLTNIGVVRQRSRQKGSTDPKATELKQTSLVQIESPPFRQGMNDGALGYFHGDTPCHRVTEEDGIDFLQGNVVELVEVGFLDEDRLRSNAGFLIGWIAAQLLPASTRPERRVF